MMHGKGYILEIPDNSDNRKKRSIRLHNAKIRGTHSSGEWHRMIEYFARRCVKCGSEQYHVEKDHIVPVYQGGCDCIHNIQPLCAKCNASKGPDNSDHRESGWQHYVILAGC